RTEAIQMAAHFARELILRSRSRLQRIVVRYQNLVSIHFAAVYRQDLVLQDITVVVKVVGGKWTGNLDKFRGNLYGAESRDFAVHAGITALRAGECKEGQRQAQPKRAESAHFFPGASA